MDARDGSIVGREDDDRGGSADVPRKPPPAPGGASGSQGTAAGPRA